MQVTVECCGSTARVAGSLSLRVSLAEGASVRDLFVQLSAQSTEFAEVLAGCACARGDAIVPRGTVLTDGDELALLPPVAGG